MTRDAKSKKMISTWLVFAIIFLSVLSVEAGKFFVKEMWFMPKAWQQCELRFKTAITDVSLEYAQARVTRALWPSKLFPKAAICTTSEGERGRAELLLFSLNPTLNDILGAAYFFTSFFLVFIVFLLYFFLWLRKIHIHVPQKK